MKDIFLNIFLSDKANRVSAEDNLRSEDRQKHTDLIDTIKATEMEYTKY